MKSTVAGVSILAFFLGLAALNGCMTSAESRPQANGAGQQPDDLIDGDLSAPADGDTASLAKDLRWLKERTAEVRIPPDRLVAFHRTCFVRTANLGIPGFC
jgi:hypothetical protein